MPNKPIPLKINVPGSGTGIVMAMMLPEEGPRGMPNGSTPVGGVEKLPTPIEVRASGGSPRVLV